MIARLHQVSHGFQASRGRVVEVLKDVDLCIERGERVHVHGASGSGKTTLLFLLGTLLRPARGTVELFGTEMTHASAADCARLRRERIGFVFQEDALLPYLDARHQLLVGRGISAADRKESMGWLERLDLAGRAEHRPAELSAGERQRVALARAFVRRPDLLLLDEPTAHLDPRLEARVFELLAELQRDGKTVVVASPRAHAVPGADRLLALSSGRLQESMQGFAQWLVPVTLLVMVLLVVALMALSRSRGAPPGSARSLLVYCAANLKEPLVECAREYETRTGTAVDLQFGGSGTLLQSARAAGRGELFLAADHDYLEQGVAAGAIAEVFDLARMRPLLAVKEGSSLQNFEDLFTTPVRIGFANPEAAAIGRMVKNALVAMGRWEAIEPRIHVYKPTVIEIANDLRVGSIDAGFVWDTTLAQYPQLRAIEVAGWEALRARVGVGVLASARSPAAALRFARYLSAPDGGLPAFRRHGYSDCVEGDPFVETPRIVLMVGAMLRPALEPLVQEFEAREGCVVERVYQGCGVLLSQMRTGTLPDAYFACDARFLDPVRADFDEVAVVTRNAVVLGVRRGNPKGIDDLEDLLQEGLCVGVAHPEQSALGALTREFLGVCNGAESSLWDRLEQSGNRKVESPTGDFLVQQLRVGALDVAIVYASNLSASQEDLEGLALCGDLHAVQPLAVHRHGRFPGLVRRLAQHCTGPRAREMFERHGFVWREAGQ